MAVDEFGGTNTALHNPHIFDKSVFSHRTAFLSAFIPIIFMFVKGI